jgi:hypothetical protein
MEDQRVWEFETSLWTADPEHYRESIDDDCLMVLPAIPFVRSGEEAIAAVMDTPRWSRVDLSDRRVSRPQEGLIVIAYQARAEQEGHPPYVAYCTSTYRRIAHDDWKVVQHQQTPPPVAG